jgi:multidrug efflux pump subunit AcrA (membrane-fusion protein)
MAKAEAGRLRAELEAARLADEKRSARERETALQQRRLRAERAAREAVAAEEARRAAAFRAEEARRAAAFRAAAAAHAERVDAYIRARRDFDGAAPTALWVSLRGIDSACPRDPAALPGQLADALRAAPAIVEVDTAGCRVRLRRLTPYRGDDRAFGEFRCARCGGRRWCSGHTYADAWQKCQRCEARTYPFAQRPLDTRASGADGGPPHDRARCGMCQRLGRLCTARDLAPRARQVGPGGVTTALSSGAWSAAATTRYDDDFDSYWG